MLGPEKWPIGLFTLLSQDEDMDNIFTAENAEIAEINNIVLLRALCDLCGEYLRFFFCFENGDSSTPPPSFR